MLSRCSATYSHALPDATPKHQFYPKPYPVLRLDLVLLFRIVCLRALKLLLLPPDIVALRMPAMRQRRE